jgi:cytochrome c
MKKVFLVLSICAVISACGGNTKQGSADSASAANQTAKAAESEADTNATKTGTEPVAGPMAPGAKLMAESDCNTCHKEDVKLIGPALKDIAAKYPATDANIDTLTNKVIRGGQGHWGNIPMAAHPTLPPADVKVMVKYILSLKK